jgi:ABC-type polysaccharide/polyol phosphate export permease
MASIIVSRAVNDLYRGLTSWRIWWLLGISDIRQRYSRSRFGQFWITLSMAIFIVSISVVFALLFGQSIREYMPYLAVNYVVWMLMSGIVTDSTTVFSQSGNFLRQEALPRSIFVMRILVRNVTIFAHNFVIVPLVLLAMGHWPAWTWLLLPIGLALILIAGFLASLLIGILCTRFRDLPQIVQNVMQIAFFITPVMWPASQLRVQMPEIIDYNPFAAFLHIAADPLRGIVPSAWSYMLVLASIAVLAAISLPLFARFRARIVYWL